MKSWRWQILEVQSWRRVGGFAGAVRCETRDLGIKWPWTVCSQDVKNILLKQARLAYLEEMDSKARARRVQRRCMVGVNSIHVAKKDQQSVDRQESKCDEEADRGRRMGAEKIVRHWLV